MFVFTGDHGPGGQVGIVTIPGYQLHQHCLPILCSVHWMTVTESDVRRINSAPDTAAVTRLRCGPAPNTRLLF